MYRITAFILLLHTPLLHAYSRLPLNGKKWTVIESISGQKIPGEVPGTPYTTLLEQGLIKNPLYRDNDVSLAWIGRTNWTYSLDFTVPDDVVSASCATLVFDGLDTIATISLNGKKVGEANNMFLRWDYDISRMLQKNGNSLRVDFTSAVLVAKSKAESSSYTIPPNCPPAVQRGECHVNQLRKEQCSFSWDWGPSFPTQGIWKPVYIDVFNSAILKDLSAVVMKVNDQWRIDVEADFDVVKGSGVKGQLQAAIKELNLTYSATISVSPDQNRTKFIITVPKTTNVPLWWPNGYGNQPLFTLNATFVSGGESSSRSLRIGFRTVELVQEPVTNKSMPSQGKTDSASTGLSFYFKVNGIPIFLKGSNWIPADSFQERITREHLSYLLSSAANVSINSMRVWGGGVYESDDLYDLCDELGILVWQDFMFSVALYPAYPQFLESVSLEIQYQVRRLKHHTSVLVWAGNNENEKGLRQDWYNVKANYSLYYKDYIELYVTTIKPVVEAEDPSRQYLSSSPSDGAESVRQGYVAQDPGSELYGDIHSYDYAADQWNASVFRIPRMASEYGIQSWCNNESLADVFLPSDFDVDSKMVDHRQHHAMGNSQMKAEVEAHLQFSQTSDPKLSFAEFVYLTQVNQAMSMRTQTEHYRRYQSRLLKDGRGLTMGALYWQLNDIWQAPTWASIDYEGRWKMLHYFARSFFNKHLISPYNSDPNTLDVFIVVDEIPIKEIRSSSTGFLQFRPLSTVSDIMESELPLADAHSVLEQVRAGTSGKLKIEMYQYSSFKPLFSWDVPYQFRPLSTLSDIMESELPLADAHSVLEQVRAGTSGKLKIEMYQYSSFKPLFSWDVPYQIKTTAESVFSKPTKDLIQDSGCPGPKHCLLYLTATDQAGQVLSTSWHMFTYPKDAALVEANVKIQSVTKKDETVFDIEISSDAPSLFVWLSAGEVLGHFSNNGFHMLRPSTHIQFFARQPISVEKLQSQLAVRCVRNNAGKALASTGEKSAKDDMSPLESLSDQALVQHWKIPQ
ncbi:beta-mannosidase [Plakobranchus ocellatus]|uniref:beta-mannosidase n=1 Tax=Plakobranchus ocellatus TaxID=259542 RepID=A0AAV3Y8S7_9GAST|nr:beta-mannosidase [Plakobranchus ocellatus]